MRTDIMIDKNDIERIRQFSSSQSTSVLTIMFTDIVGYTTFAETNNEALVQEFRREHDKRLEGIIEGDGKGLVIKFIGDSLLAVFVSPTDAAKKSLQLKKGFRQLKEKYGLDLDIRIGLHMGEVLLENGDSLDVFGRHVNKAQRVESLAHKGQIFMSYSVYDSIKSWMQDEYRLIKHGRYKLKGIKGGEEIYELNYKEFKGVKPQFKYRKINYILPLFTSLVLIVLVALYQMFFTGSNYDLRVVSRKGGALYINGQFNGELKENIAVELHNLSRFVKVEVEGVEGRSNKRVLLSSKKNNEIVFYDDKKQLGIEDNLVLVEAGSNNYGEVERAFYISSHEVTQGQFIYVVNRESSNPFYSIGENYPNNSMTYMDAIEFVNRLSILKGYEPSYEINSNPNNKDEEVSIRLVDRGGYRLPTHNEWKYAAAGGNMSKGYKYSGSDILNEVANTAKVRNYDVEEVMSRKANELGIYDMSGNVSEWTWDVNGSNGRGLIAGSNFKIFERSAGIEYRYFMEKERPFLENGLRVVRTKID